MTVELTGSSLTLDEVVRVAREHEGVAIAAAAIEAMREKRAVVEETAVAGAPAYGVTTGVGMRRDASVDAAESRAFNRSAILGHLVGLGERAPDDVVRASLVRMANALVAGHQGARPEVAEALVSTLDAGGAPRVHSLGTVGEADLAQNADLAYGALGDLELEAGEALAALAGNAFSTAQAALAIADSRASLEWFDVAAALDFEAFRANTGALHAEVARARPFPGIAETLDRLHGLLEGSALWDAGEARFLQDPLTFRCVPQLHGAARDALRFVEDQLAVELNAHQGNPVVSAEAARVVPAGNFDAAPLAAALDFLRIALAPALTNAAERGLKLLQASQTGLPEGLAAEPHLAEPALSELGHAIQGIVAEARLLAQPVSFELASTTQHEGIEDRTTMAPLAARRLAEMVSLGARVAAIELTIAAQAVDLRGRPALGSGSGRAYELVRGQVPFTGAGETLPPDLEPVVELVRSGALVG